MKARAEAHGEGDHSTCRPGQCDVAAASAAARDAEDLNDAGGDAEEGVTRDVTDTPKNSASQWPPPADLRERGQRLWAEMSGLRLGPTHVLLLERACRLADRLARLDELLEGGEWLSIAIDRASTDTTLEATVTVDRALGETRQHEVALKLLVAELRHAGRPATGTAGTPPTGTPTRGADDDDDEPRAEQYGNVTNIAGILAQG